MSLLMRFTKYFQLNFLSEWLPIELIGVLDTASCNRTERLLFLNLLLQLNCLKLNLEIPTYRFQWISTKFSQTCRIEPFQILTTNTCSTSNWKTRNVNEPYELGPGTPNKFAKSILSSSVESSSLHQLVDLLKFSPNLRSISIIFSNTLSTLDTNILVNQINGLKRVLELNFTGFATLTDEMVSKLCGFATNLLILNLSGCSLLTDLSVSCVIEKCPSLQSLNISYLGNITDASLLTFANESNKLNSISWGGSSYRQHHNVCGISWFSEYTIRIFLEFCGINLVEIEIVSNVSTSILSLLSTVCVNVITLRIINDHLLTITTSLDEFFQFWSTSFKNISTLCLTEFNFECRHYEIILGCLTHLTDFQFSPCQVLDSSITIVRPIYFLLNQKMEFINHLDFLHNRVIGTTYRNYPVLSTTTETQLVSQNTQWDTKTSDCLSYVSAKCSALKTLILTGTIRRSSLKLFCSLENCQSLTSLSFHTMSNLQDVDLILVSKVCNFLVQFTICSCPFVTSKGVVSICVGNPSIVSLGLSMINCNINLKRANKICDQALSNGVSLLKRLQMLSLFHLDIITQDGFSNVMINCKRLTEICIHSCALISEEFVRAEVKRCQVLNNVRFTGCL
jgi:hypothetical protein